MEDDDNASALETFFVKLVLSKVCLDSHLKDKASIRDFILNLCGNELKPIHIDLDKKKS